MNSDDIGELNSPWDSVRLPSLTALRCFEAAARLEHFGRAAQELHLTHGAVSRAVRLLEDDVGLPLFERRSRRVFVTPAGRKLARAVQEGLGLMKKATGELRASVNPLSRSVLSCEPTLLMRWLIPRWPDFQEKNPNMPIHLVAGGGPFRFADGIDLAIRRDDFTPGPGMRAEPLFREKTGPVCRPEKAATWFSTHQGAPVLRAEAPRLHSRTRVDAWPAWAAASGCPQPQAKEQWFDHFYFSLQACVAGLGVAIGPWHLVRDDIENGLLVAPLGFIEDGSRYVLLSADAPPESACRPVLLDWLKSLG